MSEKDLVAAAWDARKGAAAPYSNYAVGAALETDDGTVYTGANVESASYGLSCCAERVALFKAVNAGERRFKRIAIAVKGSKTPVPCGACRQLLAEYAPDVDVLLSKAPGEFETAALTELIPFPFTSEFFE